MHIMKKNKASGREILLKAGEDSFTWVVRAELWGL